MNERPRNFAYHRSITPNLAVLLGLALTETLVAHLVAVGLWGWRVAVVLAVVDLSLVVFLIALLRAIRRWPVTIADGVLTMRVGKLRALPVPLDHVAGLRETWDAAALKQPGVVNLALATWPNVVVDLSRPILSRGKQIGAIAHKLDDPAAFRIALDAARR